MFIHAVAHITQQSLLIDTFINIYVLDFLAVGLMNDMKKNPYECRRYWQSIIRARELDHVRWLSVIPQKEDFPEYSRKIISLDWTMSAYMDALWSP